APLPARGAPGRAGPGGPRLLPAGPERQAGAHRGAGLGGSPGARRGPVRSQIRRFCGRFQRPAAPFAGNVESGKELRLPARPSEYAQVAYDRVAGDYDDLWTPNTEALNARLTRELRLERGEDLADLACGTGVYTVHMGAVVHPGRVVGVDWSEGMLA